MSNLSVRIDDNIKKEAETLFETLGISMSAAINVFFRQAIREQAIPFLISADRFASDDNRLRKAIKNVATGKSSLTEHELIEVDDD